MRKVKCIISDPVNYLVAGKEYEVLTKEKFDIKLIVKEDPFITCWTKTKYFEDPLQISINTANLSYTIDFLVQNANWWDGNTHKQVSDRLKNEIGKCYYSMKQQVETNNQFEYNLGVRGFTIIGWWDSFEEHIGRIEILVDAGMNKTGVTVDVKELLEQL